MEDVNLADIKQAIAQQIGVVHEFKIAKYVFLFRPLTIRELTLPAGEIDFAELEDQYVRSATIYPPQFDFDGIKAGYVTRYADEILRVSGFDDLGVINEMLERHRARAKNAIIHTMKTYVMIAMPAYKVEDLMDLTMEELSELVVQAEEIITIQQNLNGMENTGFKLIITPVNADEEEEEEEAPAPKARPKKAAPAKKRSMSPEEEKKMKDHYLAQIRSQNRDVVNPHEQTGPVDLSVLAEAFDPETLEHITGIARPDDPIAAKLKGF